MDTVTMMFPTSAVVPALLHFLWQGLMVWGAVECLMYVAQPRRAQARYAIYCGALLLLAACPVVNFVIIETNSPATSVADVRDSDRSDGGAKAIVGTLTRKNEPTTSPAPWLMSNGDVRLWLDRYQGAIALAWLAGVAGFGARLAMGIVNVWAIARQGAPLPAEWSARVERIGRPMRFRTTPAVRVVAGISQAMAVGIVRPVVLLPLAWLSELDGAVLETVIAHELAHLRRWDLAINFIQRVIEAVLFFHPVVWWCSRRIRIEREMCCDEVALAALGNPARYAASLAYLAHQKQSAWAPLLGAGMGGTKMVLLERIRDVLGMRTLQTNGRYGLAYLLSGAVVASLVWAAVLAYRATRDGSDLAAKPIDEAPTVVADDVPTENDKILLPSYTIEPPDVLPIEALRVQPKAPHHIQAGDELQIIAEPSYLEIDARGYFVDSQGRIDLGPRFGKAEVGGMTADEATEAVTQTIVNFWEKNPNVKLNQRPSVSLTVVRSRPMQPITGEHLVTPDGTVVLGIYGSVKVAGMTIEEAKRAIEAHLAEYLDDPQVSVSVYAYNSKVYYVIVENADEGDTVTRVVVTGNETVLDALVSVNDLRGLSHKKIFIARPQPGGGRHDRVLPVDWQAIARGASTATNYQVLPGDRIFVIDQPPSRAALY